MPAETVEGASSTWRSGRRSTGGSRSRDRSGLSPTRRRRLLKDGWAPRRRGHEPAPAVGRAGRGARPTRSWRGAALGLFGRCSCPGTTRVFLAARWAHRDGLAVAFQPSRWSRRRCCWWPSACCCCSSCARAAGFHLPFGDGQVIMLAGHGVLLLFCRHFDKPDGRNDQVAQVTVAWTGASSWPSSFGALSPMRAGACVRAPPHRPRAAAAGGASPSRRRPVALPPAPRRPRAAARSRPRGADARPPPPPPHRADRKPLQDTDETCSGSLLLSSSTSATRPPGVRAAPAAGRRAAPSC